MGCPIRKGGVGSPLQVRYTKSGGGGGQFASGPLRKVGGQFASGPLRKVGGGQFASGPLRKVGGGAIRFRSITKSGGGGGGGGWHFASGPLRKVGGGGGERCKLPHWGLGSKLQKLRKQGPAPHKRTLTLLGGGGGGGWFVRTPQAPPGYGLDVCVCTFMHMYAL